MYPRRVAAPRSSVLLCALPRTGTALTGRLLERNGLGTFGEWFWREDVARNWKAWGCDSWGDYVQSVLEHGTSDSGVFGVKLMWGYLGDTLFELRRLSREYDAADLAVLSSVFPRPRFVWLRREDVVMQAVSWVKAVQTGQWMSGQPVTGEAKFDFEEIDGLYHLARVQDGSWRRWFEAQRIEPFEIVYEELCREPERVVAEALAFLGVDAEPRVEIPRDLLKQADGMNAEWAERYRRLAAG